MEIEHLIRYAPLAVKLMEIEKIRYAPSARAIPDYFFKDHKMSAGAWGWAAWYNEQ